MVNHAALDAAFAALADPTRRAIVERLARGGATVGELGAPFRISSPAVSRHLRVLERAGLIERRIEGRVHRIGIVPGPLQTVERWLNEHRDFWERRLGALARILGETHSKPEAPAWRRPTSVLKTRSASNARSRRRAKGSSPHGRRPRP